MEKPVFELKEVSFSYLGRFPALNNLNLSISQGSKVVLMGANGSGKSTLLSLLDAIIFPDKGSLEFFGSELKEQKFSEDKFVRNFRKNVGFVFQNPDVQLFCPTVKEDIIFGPLQLGVSAQEARDRLERLVSIFHIGDLLERAPHQLSIGEKRKVALASVLAVDSQILLLDEPTAGLDPQTTRDIIDIILNENASGKTIITATHDLHIIAEISDRVHVFGSGKNIIRSDEPLKILSDEQFLQENNLVHIHRHKHGAEVHLHAHHHLDHHNHNEHT